MPEVNGRFRGKLPPVLLITQQLRLVCMATLMLVVAMPRAVASDSVFDKLRRQRPDAAQAEPQVAAPHDLAEPASSLASPPVAKRLERARAQLQEDTSANEQPASEPPPVPSAVARASAQFEITDSPYLSPPVEDFRVRSDPPVSVQVETECADDDFGMLDDDLMDRPRLVDCLRELYVYAKRPLQGQSWLSRPLSAGLEFGGIWGGELIADRVTMTSGTLFMGTFGYDRGNYDGYEIRVGGSTIDTFNRQPPLDPRNTRFSAFDFSALLYPWGDSRLRPFVRFGIGLHKYKFVTHEGREIENIIPAGLIGVGMKYLFQRHVAVRMEFVDNIGFGDGLDLEILHNPSLTFGAEFRFGGHQKLYWPWHSGRMMW